jgi:hypothetical protein
MLAAAKRKTPVLAKKRIWGGKSRSPASVTMIPSSPLAKKPASNENRPSTSEIYPMSDASRLFNIILVTFLMFCDKGQNQSVKVVISFVLKLTICNGISGVLCNMCA